jgi:hypothetical protein
VRKNDGKMWPQYGVGFPNWEQCRAPACPAARCRPPCGTLARERGVYGSIRIHSVWRQEASQDSIQDAKQNVLAQRGQAWSGANLALTNCASSAFGGQPSLSVRARYEAVTKHNFWADSAACCMTVPPGRAMGRRSRRRQAE